MQGVEIKKTYRDDFDKIYPLLQKFDSPYTQDDWKKIFTYQWQGAEDYLGFHLEHEGKIVGFMGLIFSCRNKNCQKYQFCNITSLIVLEDYRAATILLIRQLKRIKNIIFTGLNPIYESYRILTMLGFAPYENKYRIIPVINFLFSRGEDINVVDNYSCLDQESRRLIQDHHQSKSKVIALQCHGKNCLIFYKMTLQNYYKIPLRKIRIHYISDIDFFNKKINSICRIFYSKFGFLSALYVDNRFLQRQLLFNFSKKISPPRICYNEFSQHIGIDELYSEAVLL